MRRVLDNLELVPPGEGSDAGHVSDLSAIMDRHDGRDLLSLGQGRLDFPLRMYNGQLTGSLAAAALGRQVLWIVLLVSLGRTLMRRAMARLEMQGG